MRHPSAAHLRLLGNGEQDPVRAEALGAEAFVGEGVGGATVYGVRFADGRPLVEVTFGARLSREHIALFAELCERVARDIRSPD